MKVKVLKAILMPKSMKRYTEKPGDTMYLKGDVIENVSEKYRERLEKFSGTHIEIIEDENVE